MVQPRLAIALTAVAIAVAAVGCASSTGAVAVRPAHSTPPAPTSPRAAGAALLGSVRLPPGARRIAGSTSAALAAPLPTLGCSLLEGHRYWRVAGTLDEVSASLRAHPGAGLTAAGAGIGWDRSGEVDAEVDDAVRSGGDAGSELVYSLAPAGASHVDIRVDAEIVVPGEQCARFGPMRPASIAFPAPSDLSRRGSS